MAYEQYLNDPTYGFQTYLDSLGGGQTYQGIDPEQGYRILQGDDGGYLSGSALGDLREGYNPQLQYEKDMADKGVIVFGDGLGMLAYGANQQGKSLEQYVIDYQGHGTWGEDQFGNKTFTPESGTINSFPAWEVEANGLKGFIESPVFKVMMAGLGALAGPSILSGLEGLLGGGEVISNAGLIADAVDGIGALQGVTEVAGSSVGGLSAETAAFLEAAGYAPETIAQLGTQFGTSGELLSMGSGVPLLDLPADMPPLNEVSPYTTTPSLTDLTKAFPEQIDIKQPVVPGGENTALNEILDKFKTLGTVGTVAGAATGAGGEEGGLDWGAIDSGEAVAPWTTDPSLEDLENGGGADLPDFSGVTGGVGGNAPPTDFPNTTGTAGTPTVANPGMWSRIFDGTATADDWMRILGTAGGTALGMLGANKQAETAERMQNQYLGMGEEYRKLLAKSYQPGFSMSQEPGYQDALDQSTNAYTRMASAGRLPGVSAGNPIGNPGAWAETLKNVNSQLALPALNNYRAGLSNSGQLGVSQSVPFGQQQGQASGGMYNALGYGLGQLTAPQDPYQNALADLFKNFKTSYV